MADDETEDENTGDGAEGESPGESGSGKKKLILFIVLPLLLIVGGAVGAYFGGLLDGVLGLAAGEEEGAEMAEQPLAPTVFYDLPEITVSLQSTGRTVSYLKLKVSLELGKEEDIAAVESVRKRIEDDFNFFLSELRKDDLKGSEGPYRIREELLIRANAASPVEIKNVLIGQMLLQ
ncbi:MAG: flagellar basal body-associated FliL family protein [Magnetospiraceae bacterium]